MAYLHLYEHPESIRRRRRARILKVLNEKAASLLFYGQVVPHPEEEGVYLVYPIVFMVRKQNGVWSCDCPRFKELGICEDVLAVRSLEEGEK